MWPDRPDGRRKSTDVYEPKPVRGKLADESRYYGRYFLNFTFDDIIRSEDEGVYRKLMAVVTGSPRSNLTLHSIHGQPALLLSYYESQIAPMVSTLHTRNGFQTALLPMALTSTSAASSALCNAMLAVAAVHARDSAAALPFKRLALRKLAEALECGGGGTEVEVAASMMLCVYSVFDEREGNWHVHLNGARTILRGLVSKSRSVSDFLLTWFLYHEVLGCFTQPGLENGHDSEMMKLLKTCNVDASVIVGSLGCSVELLEIIHRINKLRAIVSRNSSIIIPSNLIQERLILDQRLESLTQILPPHSRTEPPARQALILHTASLYYLATRIYLYRTVPLPNPLQSSNDLLIRAFETLASLPLATSPWPIFILACEAQTDAQRITVLDTLERMEDVRKIGNVGVMRRIVEGVWKKGDLRGDVVQGGKWSEFKGLSVAEPWFI
ncbi:Fc.00g085470.m01.CDS01 [Cosmosporella sp. VM-42]